MSNPILRPSDPRFQRPVLQGTDGKNQFADGADTTANAAQGEPYSTPTDQNARPFLPQYEEQQAARTGLLLTLSLLGWAASALGAISLLGIYDSGWICPLIGIAPAAAGWLLAHQDLKAIESGAIHRAAHRATRRAHWLGLTALIATLAITLGLIFLQRNFLPDGL